MSSSGQSLNMSTSPHTRSRSSSRHLKASVRSLAKTNLRGRRIRWSLLRLAMREEWEIGPLPSVRLEALPDLRRAPSAVPSVEGCVDGLAPHRFENKRRPLRFSGSVWEELQDHVFEISLCQARKILRLRGVHLSAFVRDERTPDRVRLVCRARNLETHIQWRG